MKRLLVLVALACAAAASFGATLNPVQLLNPSGSTAGQAIVSTGASSAPAWGNVTAAALGAQAANTVVANATGASAAPTAFAMPSCNTTSSALIWTPGTGFQCSTAINAAALGGATFASPTAIGSTTPSTGKFTSVSTTASAKVFAINTSAQSIANNTNAVVTGWTAVTNQNSNFVASTGVFTAPRAGFYQISGAIGFVSSAFTAGQNVAVVILKNGSMLVQGARVVETTVTTAQDAPPVSVMVQLAAGDTVSIAAFQNSGAAVALNNGGTIVWMSISETP